MTKQNIIGSMGASKFSELQKARVLLNKEPHFTYEFENFFHPYVEEFLALLNRHSVKGLLDINKLKELEEDFFQGMYFPQTGGTIDEVMYEKKTIDFRPNGPYSVYNWELFFHIPLSIAVHLSKNQRFAEAQKWFHFIFDPTSTDDTADEDGPQRQYLKFWKFLYFRDNLPEDQIEELIELLCKDEADLETQELKDKRKAVLNGYEASMDKPFMPHAVARTRTTAYRMQVLMKYLDNLIAWGDSLFRQDSIETLNEATQLYVMAANLLGPRPQQYPKRGKMTYRRYVDLKHKLGDNIGNALTEMENQFLLLGQPGTGSGASDGEGEALFGVFNTLYFCIPRNDKLLTYWDIVADRLFKIRHCMNIEGVVRQLPLFQPPIDPGMLVRAAAAGIDISSLVSGLNQPLLPVRALPILRKAKEVAAEVKDMGKELLDVLEKRDKEKLALLQAGHKIKIGKMLQDVRFLEWKKEEENTEALLRSRAIAYERYCYYQLQMGKKENELKAPRELAIERQPLDEEHFEEVYDELIGQYAQDIPLESYPAPAKEGDSSPKKQSGGGGKGWLNLIRNEAKELNEHFPEILEGLEKVKGEADSFDNFAWIPEFTISKAPQGLGETTKIAGAKFFYQIAMKVMNKFRAEAFKKEHKAKAAGKTAELERRSQDWALQANLAACELMEIGRRILASLLREQIAQHEYNIHQKQIEQSEEVDAFLHDKFTNEELYGWMQGELSKLYYEYYKLAFDTAKKAERTLKHELMRPELDGRQFIQFNYWDGGRKGLLSGEALYLDLQRMETAYLEYNKREYEIVKHITLNDIWENEEGTTYLFNLPGSLFDADYPGHYLRRIKHARLTVGEGAEAPDNISCTLTLLNSELRKSPLLDGEYSRQGTEDSRFIDYYGPVQSIVTSSGKDDGGLFELDWKDERFLPFEGAGAISRWRITFPESFSLDDQDVVLHLYYTAREGGEQLKDAAIAFLPQ